MDYAYVLTKLIARYGSAKMAFNGTHYTVEYRRQDGMLMMFYAPSMDECFTMIATGEGFSHEKTHCAWCGGRGTVSRVVHGQDVYSPCPQCAGTGMRAREGT